MKIVIIKPYASILYQGGIQAQTRMWKNGLEKLGHDVICFDSWANMDWNRVDIILFMGIGKILLDYIRLFRRYDNISFAIAPIIDYTGNMFQFILRSRFYGSVKLGYYKIYHDFYYVKDDISCYLVRSEHEKRFLTQGFNINEEKIRIVPLSYRIEEPVVNFDNKKNFCLHVSRLFNKGKNVERLIKAAIKYDFELILGGGLNGDEGERWLNNLIGKYQNIKYIGQPDDNELMKLYADAKVFALPSLVEGVGMVAMEAALYGCEIVLTKLGAPKEYYKGQAILVNPYSIDSIGKGVLKALNGYSQPHLLAYIKDNYNEELCTKKLEAALKLCISTK